MLTPREHLASAIMDNKLYTLEEGVKDNVKGDVEKLSSDELVEVQEYVRNKIYCKSSTGK